MRIRQLHALAYAGFNQITDHSYLKSRSMISERSRQSFASFHSTRERVIMTVAKSERQPIVSTEKVIEYGVAGYMCSLASTFFILRA